MDVEVNTTSNVSLSHGWQPFAHARGLHGRCTLHFTYDAVATLYVRVFGEGARRLGCCLESDNNDEDDGDCAFAGGDLALGDGHAASSSGGSSSGWSTGDDEDDEPPRCRARTRDDDDLHHRHTLVKQEEDSH